MSIRHGFIFLYVLGLLSITLSLAFALLTAAQTARTGATRIEMDFLANRAALTGAQHATTVIRQDFVANPGLPTQLNGAWRTHFWPIDSHQINNFPIGLEFTPEDLNQNDVPVENGLIEPYFEVDIRRGTYLARTAAHRDGWYNHPGIARWYEPGRLTTDPITKPLSFHLHHPVAPNGESADPAVRAGENHVPDLMNAPVWYDAELVATTDPARVRYRLRYAVAVEDLGGHLLTTVPGDFDATAVAVTSGSPTEADRSKINEVDNAVADRFAGAMSNMFRYTSTYGAAWGDLGLRGLGQSSQWYDTGLATSATLLLAGRNGAGQATHFRVGANERVDTQHPSAGGTHYYFNVGPIPSFQALWHKGNNVNTMRRHLLFTPFGRAPQRTTAAAPQAWSESRVATPWRLNLPTVAPRAISAMVYAYMPDEFRTMGSDEKILYDWSIPANWWSETSRDHGTTGSPPAKFSTIKPAVDVFTDMASEAAFAENGGVVPGQPYPGTNTSAPGSHWRTNLGALVRTNTALGRASMTNLFSATNHPSIGFTATTVHLDPKTTRHDLTPTLRRYNSDGVLVNRAYSSEWADSEYDAEAGYFHYESYWLDLTAAMMHAVAVARYAWQDQVNGAVIGDADSGKPVWSATIPATYFQPALAPGFVPGGLTRDLDVNGDGVPDVPSAFDTIAEVDAQFLRNLGEWPGDYALGTRPVTANTALRMRSNPNGNLTQVQTVVPVDLATIGPAPGSRTIKQLRTSGAITLEQAALMELIVNDMRMSFFGASPDYQDFRPIDLDDDGTVASSAYAAGRQSADPATGRGPVPERWFSLTGCFAIEKSRYYRIITRGQLFDEVRGVPVAEANMETVYVVDPDGDLGMNDDQPAPVLGNGLADSHILFQRRLNNRYLGTASHVNR